MTSPMGASSSDNDLPIVICLSSRRRWGVEKPSSSSWKISLSQLAPNSWRFLKIFLKACDGVRVTLSYKLFRSCFCLSVARQLLLIPRIGFKIKEVSSCSKGWRSHFFIVDGSKDCGFSVAWGAYTMDNTLPLLSVGKVKPWRRYKYSSPSALRSTRRPTQDDTPLLPVLSPTKGCRWADVCHGCKVPLTTHLLEPPGALVHLKGIHSPLRGFYLPQGHPERRQAYILPYKRHLVVPIATPASLPKEDEGGCAGEAGEFHPS
ncbi:hypothetical protein BHM03_00034409 [Ensete ventricosum]|nr:hypothetical protein BHM03_00034409 [Ensete ventricosum]